MSKTKVRAAIRELDRLVAKVEKRDAALALEFDKLRSQILNVESNGDWREHLGWMSETARSYDELAKMAGVSSKTLQRELRKRGIEPSKRGRKPAGLKYPVRIP